MWNLDEAVTYYKAQGAPGDQSALVGLLREVQQEHGGQIPVQIVSDIAGKLGTKESFLLAVIRRIPSLRLANSHCLELCAGPNCSKRANLAAFVEKTFGNNRKISIKYVPCMRMCGKGPNIKWDGKLYNGADEDLIRQLIEKG